MNVEVTESGVHDGVRMGNTKCRWRNVRNAIIHVCGDGLTQLIGGRDASTKIHSAMLVWVKERESG